MSPNFTPQGRSEVAYLARLIWHHRLDYAAFERLCREARKETGSADRRSAGDYHGSCQIPRWAFYEAVDGVGN